MQISNKAIERIAQVLLGQSVQSAAKAQQPTATPKPHASDRVTFTVQTKGVGDIKEAVHQAPDVRTERVNALKEAIESGTYRVQPDAVAEKMLAEGKLFQGR